MPDAPMHPQPCVQRVKARKQVTTGSPVDPAFPARWFYGFLRALPGDRAFLSPSPAAMRKHCRSLDASVEAPGPHDFTVRLDALRLSHRRRPSHPRPTFVTIAIRPSWRARNGEASKDDLPVGASDKDCDTLTRRANQSDEQKACQEFSRSRQPPEATSVLRTTANPGGKLPAREPGTPFRR